MTMHKRFPLSHVQGVARRLVQVVAVLATAGTSAGLCMYPSLAAAATCADAVPLQLFWNATRTDNFSTATDSGASDAEGADYSLVRTEGGVFPTQQPGTVPLKLYWNAARMDNFTTATTEGQNDAVAARYRLVRTEGYVYPTHQPGTVPLRLYWSATQKDNFTTATTAGKNDAQATEYKLVRIEGYVCPAAAMSED